MKYFAIIILALSMTACAGLPKPVDSEQEVIPVPEGKKVTITIVVE